MTTKKNKLKTQTTRKSTKQKKSIQISKSKYIKLTKLYSLDNIIHFKIINYNNNNNIHLLKKVKSYHYHELLNSQDKFYINSMIRENNLMKYEKKVDIIKKISEDFARGVSKYLNANYELRFPVNNAYVKLWEIYSTIPSLIPNKKNVKILHFCEAPGNWVNCTSNFIYTKRNKIENYDWRANSLNSKNPENIKKFGNDIFGDAYGIIKKHPNKWLYGEDNTGDISKVKNLHWFKNYCKSWSEDSKIDLVTGDGGIVGDLKNLQKLEFAQLCMVLSCCSVGGNCVIKHFLPYIPTIENSSFASGFFINYIYIYSLYFKEIRLIKPLSSSPNSGEFYLVGLKFKGIKDKDYNNIIDKIDKFEENQCLFTKNQISLDFSNQIIGFIEKLINLNIDQYDIWNILLNCTISKDKKFLKLTNCKQYMEPKKLKHMQIQRFKMWVKLYKFET